MGKAKKAALKKLPDSWRMKMFMQAAQPEHMKARPQLLPALAVLWLTGCRPAELEKGVRIAQHGDELTIEIDGAKTVDAGGRERGQPRRMYRFTLHGEGEKANPSLTLLRLLHTRALGDGRSELLVTHDRDYLYNSIVELGRKTFPAMRTRVSPYVFRHQTAADLKNDGSLSLADVARFMGHLSDYSAGKYGHPAHSSKGRLPKAVVVTSRPIKHSPKVDRLARFRIASAKRRDHKPS
ncbi:site-specific integrase [Burkholderia glumae]|uniref:site-specific integrase n=1 Tax=Burkholderia glumae TaxID=337 RepID=UPI0021519362|nr:site-specific integrase [Burkholderia glumae]